MTFTQDKDNNSKKIESKSIANDTIYTPVAGLSATDFIKYQPYKNKDQRFEDPRGNRFGKHTGVDYGSQVGITLGTPIRSMMSGEATLLSNYYTQRGVTDYGIAINSKDPNGKDVTVVYGHLSKESVIAAFGKDKVKQALTNGSLGYVEARQNIGAVGTTSKAGRNEYHLHMSILNGDRYTSKNFNDYKNPTEYFKTFVPVNDKENGKESSQSTNSKGTNNEIINRNSNNSENDLTTAQTNQLANGVVPLQNVTGISQQSALANGAVPLQNVTGLTEPQPQQAAISAQMSL